MATAALIEANEVSPDESETKRNVVVTGFGPFSGHSVNASWEAVKLLPSLGLEKELDINLIIEELPVVYETIEKRVPELWKTYEPLLVIHVGVSRYARNLTLERCANQNGYQKCDVVGHKPTYGTCSVGKGGTIFSAFDILKISGKINSAKDCIETSVSNDAGRYLCEFVYYTSLCQDNSRCVFIHVPDLGKPYSADQTANGLCQVMKLLVEELRGGLNQQNKTSVGS